MDVQTLLDVSKSTAKLLGLSVDVVRGLARLCERYKDSQLILQSILAQVNILKAALTRIDELAKGGSSVKHHQLALDLGNSLRCCDLLLTRLSEDVAGLNNAGTVIQAARTARLKTAFNGWLANDIQAMLDRQANSLTLLLTVYNCQSSSDQVTMLQDAKSRQIFNQVEEDGISLLVHRDSSSLFSRTTDQLSMLSREFTFDNILLSTKVYSEKSGMLVQLLRKRMQRDSSAERQRARAERSISSAIDKQLKADAAADNDKINVLIIMTYPDTDDGLMRALEKSGVISQTEAHKPLTGEQRKNENGEYGRIYPTSQRNMWMWKPKDDFPIAKEIIIHTEGGLSGREKWLTAMNSEMIMHITDLAKCQGGFENDENFASHMADFFYRTARRLNTAHMCWIVLGFADDKHRQWIRQLSKKWEELKCTVGIYSHSREKFYNSPGKVLANVMGDIMHQWHLKYFLTGDSSNPLSFGSTEDTDN